MKIKDAKWEMTDDKVGMRPKFRVWCRDCFWADVEKKMVVFDFQYDEAFEDCIDNMLAGFYHMGLRETFCSPLPTIGEKAFHNDMHYKCIREDGCDRVKVFGVPIDEEYYKELMTRRKGVARIQPWEEWEKNQDLKEQLEGLGYL